MTWFLNRYECEYRGAVWEDEWSCACDDDRPHYGTRHMEPCSSVELTEVMEEANGSFLVLQSSSEAEDAPQYRIVMEFPTRAEAERFMYKR